MWFTKSELRKQIDKYGKDKEILVGFARCVGKLRLEEITVEDIKSYYSEIVNPMESRFMRESTMKKIRIFFREHRGENCLRASQIMDDPLKLVEEIATIEDMSKAKEKKRGPGRPRDIASIRKVVAFRKEGITFREIAKALKKDPSQVFVWWKDRDVLTS